MSDPIGDAARDPVGGPAAADTGATGGSVDASAPSTAAVVGPVGLSAGAVVASVVCPLLELARTAGRTAVAGRRRGHDGRGRARERRGRHAPRPGEPLCGVQPAGADLDQPAAVRLFRRRPRRLPSLRAGDGARLEPVAFESGGRQPSRVVEPQQPRRSPTLHRSPPPAQDPPAPRAEPAAGPGAANRSPCHPPRRRPDSQPRHRSRRSSTRTRRPVPRLAVWRRARRPRRPGSPRSHPTPAPQRRR